MRVTRLAAAFAAAAVLALVASPAYAAGPSDDEFYVLSCFEPVPFALYSLDTDSVDATPIGDGAAAAEPCGLDSAFDPLTGDLYALAVLPVATLALFSADPETGELTEPVALTGDPIGVGGASLTIGLDGTAWVLAEVSGELFTLDLTTAALTSVGVIASLDGTNVMAFATDPSTGLLYALQADGELQLIDPDALTATSIGTVPDPGVLRAFYAFTIDTDGAAWVVGGYLNGTLTGPKSALYTAPLANPASAEHVGDFVDTSTDETLAVLSIVSTWTEPAPSPGPQLAATGADATAIAAGAGMLALAGLVLVASRRRAA